MCFYDPDFGDDDIAFLKGKSLVKKAEKINSALIYINFENGLVIEADESKSGKSGSNDHLDSVYGKCAQDGYKDDAEIKALSNLNYGAIPDDIPGTVYLICTSGPCDSCKGALKKLLEGRRALQCKVLYLNPPEINEMRDPPMRYGWLKDKVVTVNCARWRYHYIPSVSVPDPLSKLERQSLAYARNQLAIKIRTGNLKLGHAHLMVDKLGLKDKIKKALVMELGDVHSSVNLVRSAFDRFRSRKDKEGGLLLSVTDFAAELKLSLLESAELERMIAKAKKDAANAFKDNDFQRNSRNK